MDSTEEILARLDRIEARIDHPNVEPRVYSFADLEILTRLSRRDLERRARCGWVWGRFKTGGRVLFRAKDIHAWIAEGMPKRKQRGSR